MSTRTGFPRMDWDTGFLADPKFLHLRDLLPDPVAFGYAGFCYLRLAADAWRTCERHAIRTIVRGIDDASVRALVDAELLDTEEKVTQETFDKWVGSALKARQAQADKQARHRQSPSVTVDTPSVTRSHEVSRTGRTVGQVETVGPRALGPSEDEAEVFAAIGQAGAFIRPESGLGQRIIGLVARQGAETVVGELARLVGAAQRAMSDRQIVLGLENVLEAIPTAADQQMTDLDERREKRNGRIADQAHTRRLEAFRWTGKWDTDTFGPEPPWESAWGARPA